MLDNVNDVLMSINDASQHEIASLAKQSKKVSICLFYVKKFQKKYPQLWGYFFLKFID